MKKVYHFIKDEVGAKAAIIAGAVQSRFDVKVTIQLENNSSFFLVDDKVDLEKIRAIVVYIDGIVIGSMLDRAVLGHSA